MKAKSTSQLLTKLRSLMNTTSCAEHMLQAVIIPSSDAHQSEYLAACDKRRQFISGFTGSAGTAVVTLNQAALWTDGRYFLQAGVELDLNWKLMKQGLKETPSIEDWLCDVLPVKSFVGVNPFLYSSSSWKNMKNALEKSGHILIETTEDIIDKIWENRPSQPATELITVHPKVSGKTSVEKIIELQVLMTAKKVKWLVLTALDEVAWLFNMRASDIAYNPVFFAYCVIGIDSTHLFIGESRITDVIRDHLTKSVTIHAYDLIIDFLRENCSSSKTWLSSNSSHAIVSTINKDCQKLDMYSPVCLTKCIKNPNEIEGMRSANNKDAVALCRYYHWLEQNVPKGNVTECSASNKLLEFRKEEDGFVSLSFGTISSSGPTGSIIHYCPSHDDDKNVKGDQLYLCDAGSQFKEGTTDTTRTMHFGTPSQHEKECFTRVLKGHISLSSVIFPAGTKGYWLDTLARMHLWKAGLDYAHGTGHGVGSFLNVHEGPVGAYIGNSSRVVTVAADVELKEGMVITDVFRVKIHSASNNGESECKCCITVKDFPDKGTTCVCQWWRYFKGKLYSHLQNLSDVLKENYIHEPGYYEDGKFGIRIENAVLCQKAKTKHNFAGKQFYEFEPLALVPIQQKMIEKSMLTADEIAWLNDYHCKCLDVIGPLLRQRGCDDTHGWLLEQTKAM